MDLEARPSSDIAVSSIPHDKDFRFKQFVFNLFALLIKAIDFQGKHFEITVHIHQVTKAGQGGDYGENSEPPEVWVYV